MASRNHGKGFGTCARCQAALFCEDSIALGFCFNCRVAPKDDDAAKDALIKSLAARVAAQVELLSRRAERKD